MRSQSPQLQQTMQASVCVVHVASGMQLRQGCGQADALAGEERILLLWQFSRWSRAGQRILQ